MAPSSDTQHPCPVSGPPSGSLPPGVPKVPAFPSPGLCGACLTPGFSWQQPPRGCAGPPGFGVGTMWGPAGALVVRLIPDRRSPLPGTRTSSSGCQSPVPEGMRTGLILKPRTLGLVGT